MAYENFITDYTEVDVPEDHVTVSEHHIDFDSWSHEDVYVYSDKGESHFTDFEHKIDTQAIFASDWANGVFWALANEVDDWYYLETNALHAIGVRWFHSKDDGTYHIRFHDTNVGIPGGGYVQLGPYPASTWYYLTIRRTGTTATLEIYSDQARTNLVDTATITCTDTPYRYVFAAMTRNYGSPGKHIEIEIENLDIRGNCVNPPGFEGDQICGDPAYGQDPTHLYECQCSNGICTWVDLGYDATCDVTEPCINPPGEHGSTICGDPAYGQDPTHLYECVDGQWVDLGYNSGCDSTHENYYVSNDGDDGSPGTIEYPWRTIGKVNSEFGNAIVAGNNIYFKRGDTFTDAYLNIGVGGESESNPTIIGAYGTGDKPRIQNTGAYGIYIADKNHINIEDVFIGFVSRCIVCRVSTSYITIKDCSLSTSSGWGQLNFGHNPGAPGGGTGNHIYVLNNNLYNGHGDVIQFCGPYSHGLIQGNTVIGGPLNDHSDICLREGVNHFIIKGNTFSYAGHDIGGCLYDTSYVFIEDNIMVGTDSGEGTAGTAIKYHAAHNNVQRRNIIYDFKSYGQGGYITDSSKDIYDCMWYHDTVYNSGGGESMHAAWRIVVYASATVHIHHNVIKNNIFHTSNRYGIYADTTPGQELHLHDNLWHNNIVHNSIVADVLYKHIVYTLAQAESTFPEKFHNNVDVDPLLVDPANGNFGLQVGSPAILAAVCLTNTHGSGSGIHINLYDAGYFCDGFGLILGDEVVIGSNLPVRITNVNYSANAITVDQPISWNDGDPVYIFGCYDVGAVQSGTEPMEPCTNPPGEHGNIICGDPDYGQDPTHLYECVDGQWVDRGYNPDCEIITPSWLTPAVIVGAIAVAVILGIVFKR